MNRRHFLFGAASLPIAANTAFASSSPLSFNNPSPADPPSLDAQPMMARYRLTLDRVLTGTGPAYTPDFLLEDIHGTPGRRFTNFSGDVSGRWISALSSASAVYGQNFPVLEEVVHRVIASQHPEGYFGKIFHFDHPDDDDLALLWGNGRLLVGLMEYHSLKPNPAVLASANRLGEFLFRIAPQFNSQQMADEFGAAHFASSYICWTQQTEGLAALYAATKDTRYRDLCAAIAARMERRPADHVHGYLCSLRGTLDLYNATGDKAYLQRVEAAWQDVAHSGDTLITGGVPEAWSPHRNRTEGCAECDWLRLNLALWQATGNPIYLETAGHTLFNEFAMNQFSTGDFGHGQLDSDGITTTVYVRAWWCCTLHGLRAFPDIHRSVFRTTTTGISYDLPLDATIENPAISAHATSRLAIDGTVRIQIDRISRDTAFTIRKPTWASDLNLSLNGAPVPGLTLPHLKSGDIITAKYSMSLRNSPAGSSTALASRIAYSYGPWLLGASSEANPGYFNELHPFNKLITSSASHISESAQSPFAVPIASTAVQYLPEEFPEQPARVQLRAVAEQTSIPVTQWQLTFRTSPAT